MRISELKPVWLEDERGTRYGFMILCPHCVARGRPIGSRTWLTCFSAPTEHFMQRTLIRAALEKMGAEAAEFQEEYNVVGCKQSIAWIVSAAENTGPLTFENISVQPSMNANGAGHWHGTITNGVASDAGEQLA